MESMKWQTFCQVKKRVFRSGQESQKTSVLGHPQDVNAGLESKKE